MGYAVYRSADYRRFNGYGVPAICDHPECDEEIDRGISYACGGRGYYEWEGNCGLSFCGNHLEYYYDENDEVLANGEALCDRCGQNAQRGESGEPWVDIYEPKPDTVEWAEHVLTDESWEQWRREEPNWVLEMKRIVDNG